VVASAPSLAEAQAAFCRYLRDPDVAGVPPQIEDARITVYRDAILGNLTDFFGYNFNVLHGVVGPEAFTALVREFLRGYRSQTPLYAELPGEFIQFLIARPVDPDLPFLAELAHFEYMESVLAMDDRQVDLAGIDPDGDLLLGVPVPSPLLLPLAYTWPVHRVGPGFQPREAPEGPTYLLYHRDTEDRVHCSELPPVAARLLERLLREAPMSGRGHALAIAREIDHPEPERVVEGAGALLAEWRRQGVVLGTQRG
jgi:hypothetical protein